MDVGEITLRIVHVNDVMPHEEVDPLVVERLAERLRADGILRNPPVVAAMEDRYIVLDGATRTSALRLMGVRDALVQIVDYAAEQIRLNSWHHLVQRTSPSELLTEIEAIHGVTVDRVDIKQAEHALAIRTILCYLLLRNGAAYAVRGAADLQTAVQQLNRIVHVYRGKTEVFRSATTQLDLLLREYPDLSTIIVFPRYAPSEVMHLALNGAKLPMGITRHLIGGRALGANIPLARLASDEPLEEKNDWLSKWLVDKIHSRKVRFYQEPVFVFDE